MRLTEEQYQALLNRQTKPKRSKYGAVRTNGRDSKGENDRAVELQLMERAGAISNLREKVRYPLIVDGELIGYYEADYVYVENGIEVVEDFKSKATQTPMFKWKARHFKAQYRKDIRITT